MSLKRLGWVLPLFIGYLAYAASAKADTVQVNGTYAFSSNGYGIPPYGGTLNNKPEWFYCVDFSAAITAGDSWSVVIAGLAGSSFSLTRLKNQTAYLEMAWLVTQMMGTTSQFLQAEDQYAIWSFTGGPDPYGTNSSFAVAALAAVNGGFTGQGFEILTPTDSKGQEFLIFVPEPTEIATWLIALFLGAILLRKKLLRLLRAA